MSVSDDVNALIGSVLCSDKTTDDIRIQTLTTSFNADGSQVSLFCSIAQHVMMTITFCRATTSSLTTWTSVATSWRRKWRVAHRKSVTISSRTPTGANLSFRYFRVARKLTSCTISGTTPATIGCVSTQQVRASDVMCKHCTVHGSFIPHTITAVFDSTLGYTLEMSGSFETTTGDDLSTSCQVTYTESFLASTLTQVLQVNQLMGSTLCNGIAMTISGSVASLTATGAEVLLQKPG